MKQEKQYVWVAWGRSESGDDYGPFVFARKPSEKFLERFWRENGDYDESEPGPGDYGTHVHTQLERVLVDGN